MDTPHSPQLELLSSPSNPTTSLSSIWSTYSAIKPPARQRGGGGVIHAETSFQRSMRLVNLLDRLEARQFALLRLPGLSLQYPTASSGADMAVFAATYGAVVLGAEYSIAAMYGGSGGEAFCGGTPMDRINALRYNGFLRHWVYAAARIQPQVFGGPTGLGIEGLPTWWRDAQRARVEVWRWALGEPSKLSNIGTLSPESLIHHTRSTYPIDLEPYLQLLKNQSINSPRFPPPTYLPVSAISPLPVHRDNIDSSVSPASNSACSPVPAASGASTSTPTNNIDIETNAPVSTTYPVASARPAAAPELLDPSKKAVHSHGSVCGDISTAVVSAESVISNVPSITTFTDFLENDRPTTLRWLMHLPVNIPALDFLTQLLVSTTVLPEHGIDPEALVREWLQVALRNAEEVRAEDQLQRMIGLVVLFLQNLLRRGVIGPGDMAFECKEIWVRYAWVEQVREFMRVLEGMGVGAEGLVGGWEA